MNVGEEMLTKNRAGTQSGEEEDAKEGGTRLSSQGTRRGTKAKA